MNAHVVIDGLTALRRIDPEDAALGTALCALLRGAGMVVQFVDGVVSDATLSTESGISFSVDAIRGKAPQLSPSRVSETVAALDAIEPLLTDIEAVLCISLDATGMNAAEANAVCVNVTRDDFSLTLIIPCNHPNRTDWITRAASILPPSPLMPVVVSLAVAGPRLTVKDASDLAAGDLLLIHQAAAATLQMTYLPPMTGAYDFSTGQFSLGQTGAAMPDDTIANDFMVPLTIKLPDRMTSAGSLAALAPGTTLPLGPLTEGMPVELHVADRMLARGELVQLGDRFAVLIEYRANISDTTIVVESD